jgi:hypothetical protein
MGEWRDNQLRFPDGLTVERIDAFSDALMRELVRQGEALADVAPGDRDLDRDALRALFDQHGFGVAWEYLGVDWSAPRGELLAALRHAQEDQLGTWRMLAVAYPDGVVDLTDLVSAELGEDWDPHD